MTPPDPRLTSSSAAGSGSGADLASALGSSSDSAAAAALSGAASSAKNNNTLDKDAFLKLLVAQLKYQDPMQPSNSQEFIATTAQFTMVEKLDQLTQQGTATALVSSLSTASAMVGRTISAIQNGAPVDATVLKSKIVSGEVVLDTDKGVVHLNEIASVGPLAALSAAGQTVSALPVTPAADQAEANPAADLAAATSAADLAAVNPPVPPSDDAEPTGSELSEVPPTDPEENQR